ncbi:MAG: DUF3054 domain-containing protein [Halobacteria archaeon]
MERRSGVGRGLLIGDLITIVVFLTAGSITHGIEPWEFTLRYLDTLTPFLVGWILVTFTLTAGAGRFHEGSYLYVLVSWFFTALIGLSLRSTSFFHGDSPPTFAAVIFIGGCVFLTVWRAIHYIYDRRFGLSRTEREPGRDR